MENDSATLKKKTVWKFLKWLNRVIIWSSNSIPKYTLEENKNISPHNNLHRIFIAVLFIIVKSKNNSNFHHLMNGWIKRGLVIQANMIWQQKNEYSKGDDGDEYTFCEYTKSH